MKEPKITTHKFTYRKGMEPAGYGNDWLTPEQRVEDENRNAERIKQLKESGEYGQEYEMIYNLMSYPEFDGPKPTFGDFGILIPQGKYQNEKPELPKLRLKDFGIKSSIPEEND